MKQKHWSVDIEWREGRWDPISNAPKDASEVRGRDANGKILAKIHFANGGEGNRPANSGWYVEYASLGGSVSYHTVTPVEWQPLSAK